MHYDPNQEPSQRPEYLPLPPLRRSTSNTRPRWGEARGAQEGGRDWWLKYPEHSWAICVDKLVLFTYNGCEVDESFFRCILMFKFRFAFKMFPFLCVNMLNLSKLATMFNFSCWPACKECFCSRGSMIQLVLLWLLESYSFAGRGVKWMYPCTSQMLKVQ